MFEKKKKKKLVYVRLFSNFSTLDRVSNDLGVQHGFKTSRLNYNKSQLVKRELT